MNLDQSQIEQIKLWVAEGADIAQVQKGIAEAFSINMTYMDVRFLLDDIDAQLQDKPEPVATPQQPEQAESSAEQPMEAEMPEENTASASVSVSVSPVQRPGALASGDVVFSDGGKAEWVLDQQGRLGLIPATEGYNPPQEDIPEFQRKLSELFSSM